jgi:hypothetical protein
MSLRASTAPPDACSGDMYAGVPATARGWLPEPGSAWTGLAILVMSPGREYREVDRTEKEPVGAEWGVLAKQAPRVTSRHWYGPCSLAWCRGRIPWKRTENKSLRPC